MRSDDPTECHINNYDPEKRQHKCIGTINGVKFCLLPLGKTATMSIINTLGLKPTICEKGLDVSDYIKIVVVRDPYYRTVSSYFEMMKLRRDGPWSVTKNSLFYRTKEHVAVSFRKFLQFLHPNNFYDDHVFPQAHNLKLHGYDLEEVDEVLVFENLQEDLNRLIQKYQLNKTVKHCNKAPVDKKTILTKYVSTDPYCRRMIRSIFKQDFELYEKAVKLRNNRLK